jgi:uncharacterized protein YcfJ
MNEQYSSKLVADTTNFLPDSFTEEARAHRIHKTKTPTGGSKSGAGDYLKNVGAQAGTSALISLGSMAILGGLSYIGKKISDKAKNKYPLPKDYNELNEVKDDLEYMKKTNPKEYKKLLDAYKKEYGQEFVLEDVDIDDAYDLMVEEGLIVDEDIDITEEELFDMVEEMIEEGFSDRISKTSLKGAKLGRQMGGTYGALRGATIGARNAARYSDSTGSKMANAAAGAIGGHWVGSRLGGMTGAAIGAGLGAVGEIEDRARKAIKNRRNKRRIETEYPEESIDYDIFDFTMEELDNMTEEELDLIIEEGKKLDARLTEERSVGRAVGGAVLGGAAGGIVGGAIAGKAGAEVGSTLGAVAGAVGRKTTKKVLGKGKKLASIKLKERALKKYKQELRDANTDKQKENVKNKIANAEKAIAKLKEESFVLQQFPLIDTETICEDYNLTEEQLENIVLSELASMEDQGVIEITEEGAIRSVAKAGAKAVGNDIKDRAKAVGHLAKAAGTAVKAASGASAVEGLVKSLAKDIKRANELKKDRKKLKAIATASKKSESEYLKDMKDKIDAKKKKIAEAKKKKAIENKKPKQIEQK